MRPSPKKKRVWMFAAAAILTAACVAALFYTGVWQFNLPSREQYPLRGVDVSEYQGVIDWETLSAQGIDFAFIRATEGSGYVDARFFANWAEAAKTGLRVGAYHFFSFDSAGKTQAESFLSALEKRESMLPPAVDVELYGDYKKSPKPGESVRAELDILLEALTEACQTKPILYATQAAYDLYLKGRYEGYPLWIRSVYFPPPVAGWTFWQYSDRVKLPGYRGRERFIDMNVFCGTREEWARLFP